MPHGRLPPRPAACSTALGLADVKGAPETFDAAGIWRCWTASRRPAAGSPVYAPEFRRDDRGADRRRDRRAAGRRASSSPRATTCCWTSRPGIGCARCSTEIWFLDTAGGRSARPAGAPARRSSAARRRRPWSARCSGSDGAQRASWCCASTDRGHDLLLEPGRAAQHLTRSRASADAAGRRRPQARDAGAAESAACPARPRACAATLPASLRSPARVRRWLSSGPSATR